MPSLGKARKLRIGLSAALGWLGILSASSCGLLDYAYLYPPTLRTSGVGDGATIELAHNLDNAGARLLGYELYYRIYDADSETKTKMEADLAGLAAASDQRSHLVAKGFKRARIVGGAGTPSPPQAELVMPIEASAQLVAHEATVNLKNSEAGGISTIDLEPGIVIEGQAYTRFRLERFSGGSFDPESLAASVFDRATADDWQFSGTAIPSQGLVLRIFAFAYGQTSSLADIYSRVSDINLGLYNSIVVIE